MKIRIIKVGGKLIEDEQLLHRISQQLELESRDTILVHGGGTMAEQLATRLGIPTQMHDGRRITDQETLKVVVMAYAGWANKKIVSVLQSKGINACGLSGCDMGLITAHKREVREIDWGFVGDVDEVNTKELLELLQRGVVPVVSPITFASDGQLLNTNADSVAGAVANALSHFAEVECVFCFDKPGVLLDMEDENSLISVLSERDFQNYATQGLIHSGMLPKLTNAFQMLESGVSSVRLTSPLDLWGGTVIQKEK